MPMRLLSFRLCTGLEHLFLTVSMGLPNLSPTVIGSVLAGGVLDVSMLLQKKPAVVNTQLSIG
jgi:hypothetical protein